MQKENDLYFLNRKSKKNVLACFDLFGTLISSAAGDYVPRTSEDIIFSFDSVPKVLKSISKTRRIVIFSDYRSKDLETLFFAIELLRKIVKADIFVNCDTKTFKPNTIMFQKFLELNNLETYSGFYTGDRAGYGPLIYQQNDSDLLFAKNCGLKFLLPTEIFPVNVPEFSENQEIIITVGQPNSGRSELKVPYETVERKGNYLKKVEDLLSQNKSVYFNANNPRNSDRQEIIKLAEKHKVPWRIFWFSAPGLKLNNVREDPLSIVVYRKYIKDFQKPEEYFRIEVPM